MRFPFDCRLILTCVTDTSSGMREIVWRAWGTCFLPKRWPRSQQTSSRKTTAGRKSGQLVTRSAHLKWHVLLSCHCYQQQITLLNFTKPNYVGCKCNNSLVLILQCCRFNRLNRDSVDRGDAGAKLGAIDPGDPQLQLVLLVPLDVFEPKTSMKYPVLGLKWD